MRRTGGGEENPFPGIVIPTRPEGGIVRLQPRSIDEGDAGARREDNIGFRNIQHNAIDGHVSSHIDFARPYLSARGGIGLVEGHWDSDVAEARFHGGEAGRATRGLGVKGGVVEHWSDGIADPPAVGAYHIDGIVMDM